MTVTVLPSHFRWPAVVLALLLTAAGCAPASPPAAPVTLDFAAPETDPAYWEQLLAPFREAHPNITVNIQHFPREIQPLYQPRLHHMGVNLL